MNLKKLLSQSLEIPVYEKSDKKDKNTSSGILIYECNSNIFIKWKIFEFISKIISIDIRADTSANLELITEKVIRVLNKNNIKIIRKSNLTNNNLRIYQMVIDIELTEAL